MGYPIRRQPQQLQLYEQLQRPVWPWLRGPGWLLQRQFHCYAAARIPELGHGVPEQQLQRPVWPWLRGPCWLLQRQFHCYAAARIPELGHGVPEQQLQRPVWPWLRGPGWLLQRQFHCYAAARIPELGHGVPEQPYVLLPALLRAVVPGRLEDHQETHSERSEE